MSHKSRSCPSKKFEISYPEENLCNHYVEYPINDNEISPEINFEDTNNFVLSACMDVSETNLEYSDYLNSNIFDSENNLLSDDFGEAEMLQSPINNFEVQRNDNQQNFEETNSNFDSSSKSLELSNRKEQIKNELRVSDSFHSNCSVSKNVNSFVSVPKAKRQAPFPILPGSFHPNSKQTVSNSRSSTSVLLRSSGGIFLPLVSRLHSLSILVAIVCLVLLAPGRMSHILLYFPCRLVFGTLYPAYASYKAVRTKNVKEYVSRNFISLCKF